MNDRKAYSFRDATPARGSIISERRIFPGEHHFAHFEVNARDDALDLKMRSADGQITVDLKGRVGSNLDANSGFANLAEASSFFEPGSLGYSVTSNPRRLDGLSLRTQGWKVEALEVAVAHSSYFADEKRFPKGSVRFDCALIMRNLAHEWHRAPDLLLPPACCGRPPTAASIKSELWQH